LVDSGGSGALDPSAEDAVAGLLAVAAGKAAVTPPAKASCPVKKRKAASITRVAQSQGNSGASGGSAEATATVATVGSDR